LITLEDIRRCAADLPEVQEVTHFGLPSFRVRDKPFAVLEKGGSTAMFSVSRAEARAATAAGDGIFEEVWRTAATRIFVGLRVDLARVSPERVRGLVEHAWKNKAPKRLVAEYEAR
jgi:hypothetical protein